MSGSLTEAEREVRLPFPDGERYMERDVGMLVDLTSIMFIDQAGFPPPECSNLAADEVGTLEKGQRMYSTEKFKSWTAEEGCHYCRFESSNQRLGQPTLISDINCWRRPIRLMSVLISTCLLD